MFLKFGSTNFRVPKIVIKVLGPKKFESEKILGLRKTWLKKIWVTKYHLVRKIQVPKIFWVQKNFW